MEVVLKNVNKFDSNYYKGIEINEISQENKYLVKFFGRDAWFDTIMVGEKKSDNLLGLLPEEQIREIIKHYLDSTKINCFTGVIPSLSSYQNMCFKADGTRYLFFNIHNDGLRTIIDDISNKYREDRYNFCSKNSGIKAIKLDLASFSSYQVINDKLCFTNDEKEDIIYLTLKYDLDGFLPSLEYEFISEYIVSMVSKYNEEIQSFELYDSKYEIKGYLLKCGGVRIYFPYFRGLFCIFDIVDKYNKELRRGKEDIKKRQLKMEGF